jgi:hypothetical protein
MPPFLVAVCNNYRVDWLDEIVRGGVAATHNFIL